MPERYVVRLQELAQCRAMSTVQANGNHALHILFISTCPRCGQERAQGQTHGALRRLLHRGHPVEGYCGTCQEYWQISAPERDGLAARLRG